jgi:hypothetical protein
MNQRKKVRTFSKETKKGRDLSKIIFFKIELSRAKRTINSKIKRSTRN